MNDSSETDLIVENDCSLGLKVLDIAYFSVADKLWKRVSEYPSGFYICLVVILGLLNESHPEVFQGITLSLFRAL